MLSPILLVKFIDVIFCVMIDNYKFEERCAIMEFDGGLTRKQAEIEAAKIFASQKPKDTFDGINRLGRMAHLQNYASLRGAN
jgi:hypothetical protein